MSIKLMTKVWENGPEDRTETIVLLALADRANDDGSSCFPSVKEISQRSRLSRRGTQKVIRRLEEKGFLTVDENGGPGGTNNYQLNPARLEGRTECAEKGECDSPGGERDSPVGEPDDEKGRSTFTRNRQEPPNNRQESARVKDRDNEGVQIWVDVTGERPTIGTRQELKKYFTTEAPRWDPEAFRSVLREAYVNVDRDAHRIKLGYLESAYEKELEHDTNMAVTEDGKLKGSPEPGAEYNARGYRIN